MAPRDPVRWSCSGTDRTGRPCGLAPGHDGMHVTREEANATLMAGRTESLAQAVRYVEWRVAQGLETYLHESVYLPVDSQHGGQSASPGFTMEPVADLGLRGWDVVGVVPRTIGTALENSSFGSTIGTTWAGAISGTVAGVYVLVRLHVTAGSLDEAREALARRYSRPG